VKLGNGFITLDVNNRGRDFIVGDLHGQKALLERALSLVNFDPAADRLIALGDLIDRGPDSASLLRWVETETWFFSVQGNHEAMFKGSRSDFDTCRGWYQDDNTWARGLDEPTLDALSEIVDGMPIAIELPLQNGQRWGLVHAELPPKTDWPALKDIEPQWDSAMDHGGFTKAGSLLWGRRRIRAWATLASGKDLDELPADSKVRVWCDAQPVLGIDRVVAGHTVLAMGEPATLANLLFIETGAYTNGGRLTLLEPLLGHYWQVAHGRRGPRVVRTKAKQLPPPMTVPDLVRPTPELLAEAMQLEQNARNALSLFGF